MIVFVRLRVTKECCNNASGRDGHSNRHDHGLLGRQCGFRAVRNEEVDDVSEISYVKVSTSGFNGPYTDLAVCNNWTSPIMLWSGDDGKLVMLATL